LLEQSQYPRIELMLNKCGRRLIASSDSGARLVRAAGLGPLVGGLNLIHVVASYNGTLSISATADRDALPDPARYGECMEKAFQELLAGAS
jgi:diacylglycerol O-acyltransferase